MHKSCIAVLAVCALLLLSSVDAADDFDGVVAGWDVNNGRVLLSELGCIACHDAGDKAAAIGKKQAPNLSAVGSRVTPQYLRKFLSQPHATKAGTTMPDVMHGLSDEQREESVDVLVHYLASRGELIDQQASGASLGEIERGRTLFHTVGCVACHQPIDPPSKHLIDEGLTDEEEDETATPQDDRPSVPLPQLAMKTTVDELARFLLDPHKVRPSGRMPSLSLTSNEARAIAAYLLRDQYTEEKKAPGAGVGFAFYRGSFPNSADLAKATPEFEGQLPQIDLKKALAAIPSKQKPNTNFGVRFFGLLEAPEDGEYLFWLKSDDGSVVNINGERVVDNDGVHAPAVKEGKVNLRKGRHEFELAFSQAGGGYEMTFQWQPPGKKLQPLADGVLLNQAAAMIPVGTIDFQVDAKKAEQGRELFAKLRCASCHDVGEEIDLPKNTMPLAQLNVGSKQGCLSATPAGGLPKYDFNEKQITALQQALTAVKSKPVSDAPADALHLTMTRMNCYACHQRGDVGGPSTAKSDYFVYERVVDLGDEGRLPPPLHDVGAKLTEDGFHDMLFGGEKYRTYMATRMPQFGKDNIGQAVDLFEKADAGKVPSHKPDFSPRLVDDGRFLMGNKALSCINCHAWGEERLPGAEGMDLLKAPRRLKPSWFHAWLKDPQSMRPGTRMPSAWPQGQTFFKDIQGGKVDAQIDAVWAYLSVGPKGGFPPGLSPDDDSMLVPSDEPIVFRTFGDKISAHTILVGFRQRTHMAFDANRIRTVAAWTGAFVTTKHAWDGRAGQYATFPSNDVVWLADGPAFATLESDTQAWPDDKPRGGKIGSNRTPDGWKFKGYRLDEERVPTFLYEIGDMKVAERPSTGFLRDAALLRRDFTFTAKNAPQNLFFRAAVGDSIESKDGSYVVDEKLTFDIKSPSNVKPFVREVGGKKELLVPIQFAKSGELEMSVEMKW